MYKCFTLLLIPMNSNFSTALRCFLCNNVKQKIIRQTTVIIPVRSSFYESSRRGSEYGHDPPKLTPLERIPHGYSTLKQELKLWVEEVREKFRQDPKIFQPGDTDVIFRFDNEESLKKWRTGSDSSHKEGFSHCTLEINDQQKAVFSGVIDATPPKDGRVKYAGFCAMKSLDKRRSFFRNDAYYWKAFTHLEMRVKGDGRNYIIGLSTNATYDVNWLDLYTYALHTRGGPYWQTVKIPFSKFFLTYKGRIQDKQTAFHKDSISSIVITSAKVPGPFRLEIDYIGVHVDGNNLEEFAYEMYNYPTDIVS